MYIFIGQKSKNFPCMDLYPSLPTGCFFFVFCHLLIFFKINFFKRFFKNAIGVSNSLDLNQPLHAVGSYLGPNCLQRLSADDTRKSRKKAVCVASTSPNIRTLF